ncbi:uncharacterized protein TRIADDRAFT_58307 [Trichoplax adhaerens]|uniref:TSEN34 N-terminal domain-containing protein n=1 Tax=Trichoplax adhaerens TaxID=10228 RepID=B3S1J0_TRIAD|nr:hypothetical protein TRIADDRAFT_58307 [Trichoplax adhaerens]EDV23234.1 hypothetical protein TRIADDRAFT_58307 [Trichoplax adhaerens]|eukprot:XP_002114144.1 hypothetical protein TRIADDRAFT_58307 [Trichoplax adhaerens]
MFKKVDWKLLRRNYRIVGHLTGSLPRQPKQNTYQGLPLKLLREEATLLLEKGIAELVTCNIPEINQSQIELYNHNRESNIMEQAKIIAKEKNERDLFYREQNHLPCDVNKEANKDISDDEV